MCRLVPLEGRTRRHLRGAGCDGRESGVRRSQLFANGEVVWSRPPDAGVKPMEDDSVGDGGKKARFTQESTKETVKTIARGKPDRSGWTCGDYLAFFTRNRGCNTHPAFPAPSDLIGGARCKTRARACRENAFSCPVIAKPGLCSLANAH